MTNVDTLLSCFINSTMFMSVINNEKIFHEESVDLSANFNKLRPLFGDSNTLICQMFVCLLLFRKSPIVFIRKLFARAHARERSFSKAECIIGDSRYGGKNCAGGRRP